MRRRVIVYVVVCVCVCVCGCVWVCVCGGGWVGGSAKSYLTCGASLRPLPLREDSWHEGLSTMSRIHGVECSAL